MKIYLSKRFPLSKRAYQRNADDNTERLRQTIETLAIEEAPKVETKRRRVTKDASTQTESTGGSVPTPMRDAIFKAWDPPKSKKKTFTLK